VPSTSPSMNSPFRNLTEPLIETPRERRASDCVGMNLWLDGPVTTDGYVATVCGGLVSSLRGKRWLKCCMRNFDSERTAKVGWKNLSEGLVFMGLGCAGSCLKLTILRFSPEDVRVEPSFCLPAVTCLTRSKVRAPPGSKTSRPIRIVGSDIFARNTSEINRKNRF
jgi:hypothetical protein